MSDSRTPDHDRIAALLGSRRRGTVRAEAGPFGALQTAGDVVALREAAGVHISAGLLDRVDAIAALHQLTRDQVLDRVLEHALDEIESSPDLLRRSA
jgi:hypothetical protein